MIFYCCCSFFCSCSCSLDVLTLSSLSLNSSWTTINVKRPNRWQHMRAKSQKERIVLRGDSFRLASVGILLLSDSATRHTPAPPPGTPSLGAPMIPPAHPLRSAIKAPPVKADKAKANKQIGATIYFPRQIESLNALFFRFKLLQLMGFIITS